MRQEEGNEATNEKRKGEKKREEKGKRKREEIIDGRRRLPEDYTSRRLQFTPFGKLDIHRPSSPFTSRQPPESSSPPRLTVDEWNTPSPEFQTVLQIESGPLWIFSEEELAGGTFEEEVTGVFARSRDKGDLKGRRPTGTNQLRMNNVLK